MKELKELIYRAILVAHWRDADVDTQDGTFATTDTDEMIHMESQIQEVFDGMEANDLVCTGRVNDYIDNALDKAIASSISASTKVNHLRIKELELKCKCNEQLIEALENERAELLKFVEGLHSMNLAQILDKSVELCGKLK